MAEQLSASAGHWHGTISFIAGELRCVRIFGEEDEGVAAGLSEMEAEFREIDENGSWSAIYQVGPLGENQGGNGPFGGEADTFFFLRPNDS